MSQLIALMLLAMLALVEPGAYAEKPKDALALKQHPHKTQKISVKKGDTVFTIGGKITSETYYDKNIYLLNNNLPDENFYFKTGLALNFDFIYGQEKFDHKALEAFINLRFSTAWGVAQSYADRDNLTSGRAMIKIADALTGQHAHYSGRNLAWINEAWLQTSFNSIFGLHNNNTLHFIKLGWFPFDLGRGIVLGSWYGKNQGLIGLYNYDKEDKYVPGINITGQIVKDILSYDLYYGKMEERSKALSNNIAPTRRYLLAFNGKIPWRGVHKDNDIYAARLKWNTFKNESYGTLNVEPYIVYNRALDSRLEEYADNNLKFGSYGVGAEYCWKNFEFGTEVATNFGQQKVFAYDRNRVNLKANSSTGAVTEYYDHVVTQNPDAPIEDGPYAGQYYRTAGSNYSKPPQALKIKANDTIIKNAQDAHFYKNGTQLPTTSDSDPKLWNDGISQETERAAKTNPALAELVYETPLSANRFRPAYTNKLRGWMFVADAAYNLPEYNLKFALAYNYASGDNAPYENEKNETYKGFIGLNENYCGKRVPSVLILDERYTMIPSAVTRNSDELQSNPAFTDMHVFGGGVTWTPHVGGKKVTVNPNSLFFWKDSSSKKVIIVDNSPDGWEASKTQNARSFMGTEINLITNCEVLKNLKLYGKFATFIPGAFFKDVAGVPLDLDLFSTIKGLDEVVYSAKDFRLGHDTCYHVNIGLEYKF